MTANFESRTFVSKNAKIASVTFAVLLHGVIGVGLANMTMTDDETKKIKPIQVTFVQSPNPPVDNSQDKSDLPKDKPVQKAANTSVQTPKPKAATPTPIPKPQPQTPIKNAPKPQKPAVAQQDVQLKPQIQKPEPQVVKKEPVITKTVKTDVVAQTQKTADIVPQTQVSQPVQPKEVKAVPKTDSTSNDVQSVFKPINTGLDNKRTDTQSSSLGSKNATKSSQTTGQSDTNSKSTGETKSTGSDSKKTPPTGNFNFSSGEAQWAVMPNIVYDADMYSPRGNSVSVTYKVNKDGGIQSVSFNTGDRDLDKQLRSQLMHARFKPFMRDGFAVAGTVTIRLNL